MKECRIIQEATAINLEKRRDILQILTVNVKNRVDTEKSQNLWCEDLEREAVKTAKVKVDESVIRQARLHRPRHHREAAAKVLENPTALQGRLRPELHQKIVS